MKICLYEPFLRRHILAFFLLAHSGVTSLYAEDQDSHTPILMAAAHRQATAFQCFMEYIDLESPERNPVFKILHVEWKQAEILEVRIYIYMPAIWMSALIGIHKLFMFLIFV